MAQAPAQVLRPGILAALLAGLGGAALLAGAGLVNLALSLQHAPLIVLREAPGLAETLEKAPWVGQPAPGPVVWALASPSCRGCAAFLDRDLAALQREGYAVRLILVAPERASAADVDRAVALARARTGADSALAPGEREGFAEWGRASLRDIDAVLAANDGHLALPALIWRHGPEWRVLNGRDAQARAWLAADLKPAA